MREQMNIVMVGHVDHGKSTLVGRLLADTGSLPEGKLDAVRKQCDLNSRPFEYAFLLDALKDEQSQGITIDSARCFFKTQNRDYIIIDAPGHIEFLKNMISGAARAEAAILIIDADEGVQENSRRHGYMLSLLGIKQFVVVVNKMDLVDYSEDRFNEVKNEYQVYLDKIGISPLSYVPISAMNGDNLISFSENLSWYKGKFVLDYIDLFTKEASLEEQPFRFPIQDIYKFTSKGDDRRIFSGTVHSGSISVGDKVIFYPSQKESEILSVEGFNESLRTTIAAPMATGFTLKTQIYIKPGEMMCKLNDKQPCSSSLFKANIFWLGKNPLSLNKNYKLKIGSARVLAQVVEIINVLDASNLSSSAMVEKVDRHEVAECVIQTLKPFPFDLTSVLSQSSRFVLIDDYEIRGGGIIIESLNPTSLSDMSFSKRHYYFERNDSMVRERAKILSQEPKLIVITGPIGVGKVDCAKELESSLLRSGCHVYYLGLSNDISGVLGSNVEERSDYLDRIISIAYEFCQSGHLMIISISDLDDYEAEQLRTSMEPFETIFIQIGDLGFNQIIPELQLSLTQPPENAVSCEEYLKDIKII